MTTFKAPLLHRGVVRLKGSDKVLFLQGLVTNDVRKVDEKGAIYAALLTPQGRFLYDLFITQTEDGDWLIDCERPQDLIKRLNIYKLRSDVYLEDLSHRYGVYALWGDPLSFSNIPHGDILLSDPRSLFLGQRLYAHTLFNDGIKEQTLDDYDRHRLSLGVADGGRDIPVERGIILECNFEEMGAIDWQKGCYMGQELTARTRYRGLVRKRLFPVKISGKTPEFGSMIVDACQQEVGEVRTTAGEYGLALLRLSIFEEKAFPLMCEGAVLDPWIPDWMNLQVPSS